MDNRFSRRYLFCGFVMTLLAEGPAVASVEDADSESGHVVHEFDGGHVVEVRMPGGAVAGYKLDPESRRILDRCGDALAKGLDDAMRHADLSAESPIAQAMASASGREARGVRATAVDGGTILECGAAISLFVGTTVFPAGRVAQVALRLARLVGRYGVKKFIRIMTGAVKISSNSMKDTFVELAKALTGISSLGVCAPIFQEAIDVLG